MIILLIGTSSSGKSTMARRLQERLPGYWHLMGLDATFSGVPTPYGGGRNGPLSKRGFHYVNKETDARIGYGDIGERVLQGMIDGALAMHHNGLNVLFDDMLIDDRHASLWKAVLIDVDQVVVRMTADPTVLLMRDQARGNPPNLSINHITSNQALAADVLCDSSNGAIEACIASIERELQDLPADPSP